MSFLSNKYVRVLTIALLLQLCCFYAVAFRSETVPPIGPLNLFPNQVGPWTTYRELPLEKEVQDVLKADDTLNRIYAVDAKTRPVNFFLAYFKTQRTGQSPHSPKNCLPGAGYDPIINDRPSIEVPGLPQPIQINRFVVQKGASKSVVLYWYQSHGRIVASEYLARFWSMVDAVHYRRSDTSLVRVSVEVEQDPDAATNTAYEFVRDVFPALLKQLPQ